MKKLNLKLLASLLSISTILSSAPASATGGCGVILGAASAALAGVGVVYGACGGDPSAAAFSVLTGVGCSFWSFKHFLSETASRNRPTQTPTRTYRPVREQTSYEPPVDRYPRSRVSAVAPEVKYNNANLTNTAGLCHWHALVQQLFSIKFFRDFIKNTNPGDFYTSEKFVALRTLFQRMELQSTVSEKKCLELAEKVLPHDKIGRWQDMHEDWVSFMSGIATQYKNYCRRIYRSGSNIFETPLKLEGERLTLQSILNKQEDTVAQREAVRGLFSNPDFKKEIMDKYFYKFTFGSLAEIDCYWDYISTGDLSDEFLNIVATDLSDLPCVKSALERTQLREYDIPVIEGQFSVFISRGIANNQINTKNIDFGNGTIFYKGNRYHLTGVSYYYRGHYCTLKEQSGHWYLYDDRKPEALSVSWEDVKRVSPYCTMLTFTQE